MKKTLKIVLLLTILLTYSCNKDTADNNTKKSTTDDIEFNDLKKNKEIIYTRFNIKIEDDLDVILDKKFTFQILEIENITNNNLLIKNCSVVDITKENNMYYIFISTLWSKSLLKLKASKEIVDKIVNNDNELPYSNLLIINLNTFSEVKLKYKLEPECFVSDYETTENGDIVEDTIELSLYHPVEFERMYYGEGKLLALDF